jgi:hypothetical protein
LYSPRWRPRGGRGPRRAERGVEKRGGDAAGLELVDLILHQRDERRDDDGEAGAREGGQLEAEGFAAAGGEEGEHIAPASVASQISRWSGRNVE